MDIILAVDSQGLCVQKCSHNNASGFEQLRSYDQVKLRTKRKDY
jgi:hypothetical protein